LPLRIVAYYCTLCALPGTFYLYLDIEPREKMDEYYNYVNNNSPPPDFEKDDPDNNKFDEMIKKLRENDDDYYNDIKKRERLSNLYKNLVENEFIYTYLLIDYEEVNLTPKEKLNFESRMTFHLSLKTFVKLAGTSHEFRIEYLNRLMSFSYVRVFVDKEYKLQENLIYGSLDILISTLENDVFDLLEEPVLENSRISPTEKERFARFKEEKIKMYEMIEKIEERLLYNNAVRIQCFIRISLSKKKSNDLRSIPENLFDPEFSSVRKKLLNIDDSCFKSKV